MRKNDEMPQFRADLPRTSHVLSHEFDFTCTTAHLLPIFHTVMNPGEKIRLGFDFNLRTMPLEAAAFGDIDVRTEYFFVPMQLLFQPFDAVYYGVSDNFSSNYNLDTGKVVLPCLDMEDVCSELYQLRQTPIRLPQNGRIVESIGQSSMRFLDMLGYNPIGAGVNPELTGDFYNPTVFPYPILAYHCIYQYFYRLDSREKFDSEFFNWDKWYKNGLLNYNDLGRSSSWPKWRMFCLQYRPLDNDYFTDIKVSPVVDVLNLNDRSSFDLAKNWLSRESIISSRGSVLSSGGIGVEGSPTTQYSPNGGTHLNPSQDIQTNFGFKASESYSTYTPYSTPLNGLDINTANIRAMFANEKLWSITGRAKKNYDDQTLAHFGFKVPHDVKHQISCFGKDYTQIHIGEVISTASTENAPLGEIAGKGYGSQKGITHDFVAPCHGVVMAIFSVTIRRNYEAGILKANVVTGRNDLYIPEYDHLGMQPIFGYESNFLYDVDGNGGEAGQVLGWQYRYEQWKRRYNRTNGAFRSNGSLRAWVPTFVPYGETSGTVAYESPTKLGNPANTESYQYFMNFPSDGNQIFLGQYQTAWSSSFDDINGWNKIYDFDPFVVNGFVTAVLVSNMSDYSLPRLDA